MRNSFFIGFANGTINLSYFTQTSNISSSYPYLAISRIETIIVFAIYPHSCSVVFLKLQDNLLISQDSSNNTKAYDLVLRQNVRVDSALNNVKINDIYCLDGSIYFKYDTSTIRVTYSPDNLTISATTDTSAITLPGGSAVVTLVNSPLSLYFATNSLPQVYQISPCLGQSRSIASLCTAYDCSVVNCLACTLDASLCDQCLPGFQRN